MPNDQRRAAGRRRAWGRGPIILRFEPLEGRALLSTAAATTTPADTAAKPDLAGQSFQAPTALNWGSAFEAQGVVVNQGNAAVTKPFHVDIYASPTPALGQGAVLLGEATVSAAIPPGGQSAYKVPLTVPSVPLTGLGPSGAFYLAAVIDPQNAVAESSETNNADVGAGFDYQLVTPPPVSSAALYGNGLTLSPAETDWGGTFTLSQQITNFGNGDAPATRALIVLTPSGATPGGASDVTIGSVNIPALPAGQSVTVNPTIVLPQVAPTSLAGASKYTLSVVQDGDYVTNAMYPHAATQGYGQDQAVVTITTPGFAVANKGAKANLEVLGVAADSQAIKWGQTFQVGATLENAGTADPGPFKVRFLLVGSDGTLNNALFLADATVNDLAPGTPQNVTTMVKLPATLPGGATLNSAGLARIAVVIDPENTIDEPRSNTTGVSDLIQLQVVGRDGQTTPAGAIMTPTTATTAAKTTAATPTAAATKATTATKTTTAPKAANVTKPRASAKTAHKPAATPKPASAPKRKVAAKPAKHTFEHNLKVFPKAVSNYFKKTFNL